MGAWAFSAVLVAVFTSLFFVYGSNQAAMGVPEPNALAGIMQKCHEAAVAELKENTTLGASASSEIGCNNTDITNDMANGLAVTNIKIRFHPGSDVGIVQPGFRTVVTYLEEGDTINGVSFNKVWGEIGNMFLGDPAVGIVEDAGIDHHIESVEGIQVLVPDEVPEGAIAMVTTIEG